MEVKGICNVCGKAAKMYTCSLCGGLVCSECYYPERGVCKLCKKNIRIVKKSI